MNANQRPASDLDPDRGPAQLAADIDRLADAHDLERIEGLVRSFAEAAEAYRAGMVALEAGEDEAAELELRRAAERGHPEAAYDLAAALLRRGTSIRRVGRGPDTDRLADDAAAWLLEAQAQGVLSVEDVEDGERRLLLVDLWLKARIADDPGGADWKALSDRLARYAFPVLTYWLRSGAVRARAATANQGGPVLGLSRVPEDLQLDGDDAVELATDIVMKALGSFPARGLPSWDPTRGKDLRSYFVGYCLMKLPDAYRSWARRRTASRRTTLSLDEVADIAGTGADPEETAVQHDAIRRLAAHHPAAPWILRLKQAGYTPVEIDEKLQAAGILMPDDRTARIWHTLIARARADEAQLRRRVAEPGQTGIEPSRP